jgi:cytoskeletal protein RodZ
MNDFGGKLRQARERRGVSLRQIATSTKISAAALEALERNDISKLPGGIFSRAFVRSYAVEVGLDPDETVREFLERFQSEPPPPTVVHAVPESESNFESQQRVASLVLKLVVVSVAIVGVILYFTLRNRASATGSDAGSKPAGSSGTALPAPPAVEAGALARPAPSEAAAQFTLDVHPTGDCWIQLTVDGREVIARLVQPGEKLSYKVSTSAVLLVGNAATFAYSINGRPGRALTGAGQLKTARLSLTRETVDDYIR